MSSFAPRSFLIIQTAFTGDVILATALIEKLHHTFPDVSIDFLLRKGNETLLTGHPFLRNLLVWDKKQSKMRHLLETITRVRGMKYDCVVNVHRFFSSGLMTVLSGAKYTIGFDKNPLSLFFARRVKHVIQNGVHEIQRNQHLIEDISGKTPALPKLYPSERDYAMVLPYRRSFAAYICLAPASIWFTKQFPAEKWVELIRRLPDAEYVYLLGSPADIEIGEAIRISAGQDRVVNLAGKLSYLESAALMQGAAMNYVNDSAPLHLASAMNSAVTVIYCSTVPAFGFGPLSDKKFIVETEEKLSCRPCGLHGFKACPQGHFKCALTISAEQLAAVLKV